MEIPIELIQAVVSGQHGSIAQTVLLLMIWLGTKKTAKAVESLSTSLTRLEISHELRISNLEKALSELKSRFLGGPLGS